MAEEKEIKVNDRRASAGATDTPKAKGDGFVMKEAPESAVEAGEIDFSTFIFSLATGALINMGIAPDPTTKKIQKNIELARQNIDLLALLKDKTKGNLSSDENQLMENLLAEVRLRFVEASKR